ncbi:hypothetical protein SAMN05421578_10948 [Paenibacillus macquariensis]|uniref:Uncharacterized protein n=1 Tax=Paenibacillus macquariensis TaxID=948756 RepID=A0ABY1K421_9BACL|nr:hypothetical protein SAMN05421578_10948 [Paenibacillus macquariensis]
MFTLLAFLLIMIKKKFLNRTQRKYTYVKLTGIDSPIKRGSLYRLN